ncbi:hypothetical protein K1719_008278 [Acacia pycnantha]|nr:hypothetical protein K1719_008278 [Acacia pycnantha]
MAGKENLNPGDPLAKVPREEDMDVGGLLDKGPVDNPGVKGEIGEPWMLVGDFNEIRSPTEQRGGGRINEVRCNKFNQWIEDCNLIDVEASGPFFTWKGPKWEGLERVYKRLDRCLGNIHRQEKFEEAEVRVIPREEEVAKVQRIKTIGVEFHEAQVLVNYF